MPEPLLTVRGLCADHDQTEVLHGLELDVSAGEIVFVVGSNGAGKSTLLRCLAGRLPATAGSVYFAGGNLLALRTRDRIRNGVVLCPEGRHLFADMTVRDNLLIGAHHRRDRHMVADDLRELCRQIEWLEGRLRQPAGTLSGGEQQVVAVARAWIARPRLLLLDEPTIGLAPAAITELVQWLRLLSARSGVTILGAEQSLVFARQVADRCRVLTGGRLAATDAEPELGPDELQARASSLFGIAPRDTRRDS